jgi:hypothetical protein
MIEIMQSSIIGSPAPPIHPWDRIPCQQQTYPGFRILYIGKLKQLKQFSITYGNNWTTTVRGLDNLF